MLEPHLVTVLLAGMAIAALTMAFRLGMGLLGIYSLLHSEGEEVVITLMAVLSLGLLGWGWPPARWWPSGSGQDAGGVRHLPRYIQMPTGPS